ncbi:MAG TPA: GatB/YqeY domain-containing protein [Thiothrix sp.]|nr:GatB/YqeY domain-containing protein [Thiothrix sp.]
MSASLKARIFDDMKSAMREKAKDRLQTIRLILAAVKQQEVDSQSDVDDADVSVILDKLVKQRRDSIKQYEDAGRDDLADIEKAEMVVIQEYLPEQLTDAEIDELISAALEETGASSMKEMGKVMAFIKPQAQGRADMGKISGLIKARF